MNIQLVRHSTLFIQYAGYKLLIDPMLSPAGAMAAVPNTANTLSNPLVNLKINIEELLKADAVLLTHTHRDHFDSVAAELLRKDIAFLCQPQDVETIRSQGFQEVTPIEDEFVWNGIRITRTTGQHGVGEIGRLMGPVSGFVLQAPNEPTLYIAGDTIWCEDVAQALTKYQPEVAVVFAGGAEFLQGGPITMTSEDIRQVCLHSPNTRIVVAHMETWNHCFLKRPELKAFVEKHQLQDQVFIPEDGESIH
ncbi:MULTISPECIES: MBL fold metallo-hydrolase [unclassified Paenibacillus]|uniref:MBL fold metallo-hydrolase n=1 Tax=unclassified Paenibacillus TaxID=185978 RepID=UPI00363184DE